MAEASSIFNNGVAPSADPATPAKASAMSKEDQTAILNKGREALRQMTDAEREALGSASGKLIFQHMLGNPFKKGKRRTGSTVTNDGVRVGTDEDCSGPCGFVFKATQDVEVPRVSAEKTTQTGFAPEDVSYQVYPAGSEIIFTYLELFLLGIKPEYSLRFGAEIPDENGNKAVDPKGFRLDVKLTTYLKKDGDKGKTALPSPSPALVKGQIKETMIDICAGERDAAGEVVWTKPEYAEKFGVLFKKTQRAKIDRDGASKPTLDKSATMAAVCREIVGAMQARG